MKRTMMILGLLMMSSSSFGATKIVKGWDITCATPGTDLPRYTVTTGQSDDDATLTIIEESKHGTGKILEEELVTVNSYKANARKLVFDDGEDTKLTLNRKKDQLEYLNKLYKITPCL